MNSNEIAYQILMSTIDRFAAVPTQILIMILSHIPEGRKGAELLSRVSLVSKRFKTASEANILWIPVAEKYCIPIDITAPTSVKEQVRMAIPRANEIWKKLMKNSPEAESQLSKAILCTSLARYPFENAWSEAISKKWIDSSIVLSSTEHLSYIELMPIFFR